MWGAGKLSHLPSVTLTLGRRELCLCLALGSVSRSKRPVVGLRGGGQSGGQETLKSVVYVTLNLRF